MGNSDTTNKLVHRITEGDKKAFEELFQLYHKQIYSFAYKITGSSFDAEEIVQNVFIAIWDQRKNLQIITSFLSYLFGIARHHVYRYIQQKLNHEAFVEFYLYNNKDYTYVTEEDVLYNELKNTYQKIIDLLPERRREIFILSRNEGLSYKEIAEKLGITENTVDTQIRHALAFLRYHLLK
jgi:RNA polymerase sigma-70 factor (ECF subfamily)